MYMFMYIYMLCSIIQHRWCVWVLPSAASMLELGVASLSTTNQNTTRPHWGRLCSNQRSEVGSSWEEKRWVLQRIPRNFKNHLCVRQFRGWWNRVSLVHLDLERPCLAYLVLINSLWSWWTPSTVRVQGYWLILVGLFISSQLWSLPQTH